MSTLSLSIIALVAVVIGAVILFNFWQSRVNRREAERLFRQESGALDEQAGIARRRRQSFSRPPSEDALPEDDAVTLPLYADGRAVRTEPSLREDGDWDAAAGAPGAAKGAGAAGIAGTADAATATALAPGRPPVTGAAADPGAGSRVTTDASGGRRPVLPVDAAMSPRPTSAPDRIGSDWDEADNADAAAVASRDAGLRVDSDAIRPTTTPIALPEGIDPAQRETLGRYADDLRRITERMPTAPAPPMSAKASVAPSGGAGSDDPEAAYPARDALPPMAVSPAAAAVYLREAGTAAEGGRSETPATPGAGAMPAAPMATGPSGGTGPAVRAETTGGDDGNLSAAVAVPVAQASGDTIAAAPVQPDPRFPSVDLTIVLAPASPVNADRLIALGSSLRHAGSKPVRLDIDRGDGVFVPLQSGVMVSRLQLSVLLANRQGPLNAVELSDFMSALGTFAQQIGASFTPPDLNQVLGRARAVDALAAELDTQVEILVECPERLTPSQFAGLGRRLDLYDRGGSRFACLNDGGEVLYMMTPGDRPALIRFTLDVPRVTVDNDPWRSLVNCATRCAEAVGGRVIDSEGRGLSIGMIDAVSRQLARRHEELTQAGLAPGSAAALRVFN